MLTVTLYMREECHLCEQAKADLESLQEQYPHRLVEVDIDSDPALQRTYLVEIPVIEVGPYRLKAPFDRQKLMITLGAASDRRNQLEEIGGEVYEARVKRGQEISRADKAMYLDFQTLSGDLEPGHAVVCWFAISGSGLNEKRGNCPGQGDLHDL